MANMHPINVLLVDDDEDDYILTREIFREIPQREKYTLTWVNNYEEAINSMLKSHYDVYLVDYRMGKYTGLDLLNEAIKSNVDEPIIILTGKGDSKVDEEALEIGAADYLVKDQINPYTIERSIRYALKHKQALKALRESENKFRIIFERSKEPFLIMDSLGGIRDMNHAGLKFLGYNKEEILNIKGEQLFRKPGDSIQFADQIDQKGAVNDFQTSLLSKTKEIKPVSISAFLQIDQHATEELYYCIIHDIESRNEALKASVDAEKIAITEKIAKILENEITNPLSNINLSLEQLKLDLGSADESTNLYVDIIKSNFKRINLLINDFIKSTQTVEMNIRPIALNVLLDESLDLIAADLVQERVSLSKGYGDLKFLVDVDYELMLETLVDLLHNAVAANADLIELNVERENDTLIIEIKDNGEGISDEHVAQIFDPFFSTRAKGLGLGLTNARKTINNHQAQLNFKTAKDVGSSFFITLPLSRAEENSVESST